MPVYNPTIFNQPNVERAQHIILTPEAGMTPAQRWASETPYLLDHVVGHVAEGSTILDYGCGIGRMAPLATTNRSLIGVDMSPTMLRMAGQNLLSLPNVALMSDRTFDRLADGHALTVDAVLAFWVIQHVAEPQKLLRRITRVLRPGGALFLLNRRTRCVPTYDAGWWDDGLDIFKMIAEMGDFRQEHEWLLPPGLNPSDSRFVRYVLDYSKAQTPAPADEVA